MPEEARRKSRRSAWACVACRQSKIKCSGVEPCANCRRRTIPCHFHDAANKVVVSEKYLQELQQRAQGLGPNIAHLPSPGSHNQATGCLPQSSDPELGAESSVDTVTSSGEHISLEETAIDASLGVWTDPFAGPSTTIKNPLQNGRGWSMMTEKLHGPPQGSPVTITGDIYPLRWNHVPDDVPPDISALPSIDRAVYLFNTTKFHLDQHYRFFEDGATFMEHLNQFYHGDAQAKASNSRVWFAQFLIVLAFGTAFISRSRNPLEPPGKKYFVRAMSLMPDHASIWKHSLLGIETLALSALYLYSIDHRESALLQVGQALRIAQMEGLHTRLPESQLGHNVVKRCRSLWGSLWIMDRHISTSNGLPVSTPDCGASPLTAYGSTEVDGDLILSLQAKLSNLMWAILNTVYKTERTGLAMFLENTRSILHTLAGHAKEIERIISTEFQNSVGIMPEGTRHITLLYHQCVIVATRPLLLSVLRERLENLGHGQEDLNCFNSFLALTTTLITAGIKSAAKTLYILSNEENLLETFLPFDLEFIHSAALHLLLARTLFPATVDGNSDLREAHTLLDEMIGKCNRIAQARKTELVRLENLCQDLVTQSERRGLQTLNLLSTNGSGWEADGNVSTQPDQSLGGGLSDPDLMESTTTEEAQFAPSPSVQGTTMTSNFSILDDIGISSDEFFAIVNEMENLGHLAQDFAGFPG